MKSIGIDIGTTTICAVLFDTEQKKLLDSKTLPNQSAIEGTFPYEKMQDPSIILKTCKELLSHYRDLYTDIISIGITGQMHGILYLNDMGCPVSPLYTWQDGRGNLPFNEQYTYAEYLRKETGSQMATGFGFTTHFYNTQNHLVPPAAVNLCTIGDYIAMNLCGLTNPILHPSMAASLGLYLLEENTFDFNALKKLKLLSFSPPALLQGEEPLGLFQGKITVSAALGDNQASFLGSVDNSSNVLVNVGTGSQISVCCNRISHTAAAEYRPYLNGTYLMVGSSLCGGYAYALLKDFFEQTAFMLNANSSERIYEQMNDLGTKVYPSCAMLRFDTLFQGSRKDPSATGSISNLRTDNFTPGHFIVGCLQGICRELHAYYRELPAELQGGASFVGSGNGIRKNPLLQKIFEDTFDMKLHIPQCSEEAAFGTALYSLYASKHYHTFAEIQDLITIH